MLKNKAAQEMVALRNKKKGKRWLKNNATNAANIRWEKVKSSQNEPA